MKKPGQYVFIGFSIIIRLALEKYKKKKKWTNNEFEKYNIIFDI